MPKNMAFSELTREARLFMCVTCGTRSAFPFDSSSEAECQNNQCADYLGLRNARAALFDVPDVVTLTGGAKATPIKDQPPPKASAGPAMQDLVIADIEERKRIGIERYGQLLLAHTGRDALVDLYQELLDATMYIRQVIYERDHPQLQIWHGTLGAHGGAVCGADYPNLASTTTRSHVNCPSCRALMG